MNRVELQSADVLCRFKIQNRTAEIRALGTKYFLTQRSLFIDCGQDAALVFEVISRLENNKKLPKEAVIL